MTGLGERSHLLGKDTTPDVHVQDVVNAVRWRELERVTLVGHSYGGMIISAAARRIPDKVSHLVYLDAFVTEESGQPLIEMAPAERVIGFRKQIDAGRISVDPDNFEGWIEDPAHRDWLRKMCTPHPAAALLQGVTLEGPEPEARGRLYILAERNKASTFREEYEKVKSRSGWEARSIDANHDAMIERPGELAAMLDDFVQRSE